MFRDGLAQPYTKGKITVSSNQLHTSPHAVQSWTLKRRSVKMSLGFSLEDFRTIGERSWKVYKACRVASSEFQEIAGEVLSLHAVLKLLQDASEDSKSLVSRAADSRKLEVSKILRICRRILDAIDNLVTKYHSLGTDKERKWHILRHGSALEPLRRKLMHAVSNLNLFLNTLETTSLARIESLMEKLLQEVRAGRRTPSVLSSVIDNAAVGWPQLKTELAGVGVPKADIEMFREPIQEWIREADEDGILEETEPSEDTTPRRVHLRRLSFRAPPSSTLSAGEVIASQPTSHATQQPASTREDGTDEDGLSSSTLSVGGVIVSQPTSPTAEHLTSTEDGEADKLEGSRIARNISFSEPVPLLPLSLPPISAFPTESSEAKESILAAADKTGPIMPEPYAKIEPHVTSNTTKDVSDIGGEVMSHTASPSISPRGEINFVTQDSSENAPHAKGYISVDAMSPSRRNPNNQPPSGDSNNLSQAGREVPSQGFLLACLGRCKDDPYDTRYLIEEEIKTVR